MKPRDTNMTFANRVTLLRTICVLRLLNLPSKLYLLIYLGAYFAFVPRVPCMYVYLFAVNFITTDNKLSLSLKRSIVYVLIFWNCLVDVGSYLNEISINNNTFVNTYCDPLYLNLVIGTYIIWIGLLSFFVDYSIVITWTSPRRWFWYFLFISSILCIIHFNLHVVKFWSDIC